MDGSFCNQVLAQIYLYQNKFAKDKNDIFIKNLPIELDQEVAKYMVEGFSGVLTQLTEDQKDYLGISDGIFKPENYKY